MGPNEREGKTAEQGKVERSKHWFWDSWKLLAIISAVLFTIRSILVSELTVLQYVGLYYMSTGPPLVSGGYFIYKRIWAQRNNPADKEKNVRKVLFLTWENNIDWHSILACSLGALNQIMMFVGVIASF